MFLVTFIFQALKPLIKLELNYELLYAKFKIFSQTQSRQDQCCAMFALGNKLRSLLMMSPAVETDK